MDLQKFNQEGLSLPDDTILVKLPEPIYQEWWSQAATRDYQNKPIKERQEVIFVQLKKWVMLNHPGYGIVAFEDFTINEAAEVSRKTGKPITWGMYLLLQKGGSMQPISLTDKLLGL